MWAQGSPGTLIVSPSAKRPVSRKPVAEPVGVHGQRIRLDAPVVGDLGGAVLRVLVQAVRGNAARADDLDDEKCFVWFEAVPVELERFRRDDHQVRVAAEQLAEAESPLTDDTEVVGDEGLQRPAEPFHDLLVADGRR